MKYYISNELDEKSFEDVVRLLHTTYWAANREESIIKKSFENSICYVAMEEDTNKVLGFARIVTDFATMYYLADVCVDEAYRKNGIGKAIVDKAVNDERLKGCVGILLTRDAHGLYEKFGFMKDTPSPMWRDR